MTAPAVGGRPCRLCAFWKRRGPVSGDCFEPTKPETPWPVNEHDACTFHEPKIIEVTDESKDKTDPNKDVRVL